MPTALGHVITTRTVRRLVRRAARTLPRTLTMTAARQAQPLRSVKGVTDLSSHGDVVEWDGKTSVRTFHVFVNETSQPVDLYWFYEATEKHHGTIQPGSNVYVGTYTFNQWKVKSSTGKMLAVHAGQSATVTVKPSGCVIEFNSATVDADDREKQSIQTSKGTYAIRSHVLGMPVWAFDCVPDNAVQRAAHITQNMLQGLAPGIMQNIMSHRPAIAVFGRRHVVSDVPPHSFMRHNVDRNLNTTSRGLGGTTTVPVTSCSEENLTMEDDWLYPCQSILVHEMGHAVQNLGMDLDLKERVQAAYTAAVNEGLYPEGCYMISNDHEYWATGTEAWFESTIRVDVNGGVNSRDKARSLDPRLAALLAEVYGDGQWRFHHDCPKPLSFERGKPPSDETPDTVTPSTTATTATTVTTTATPTSTLTTTTTAAAPSPTVDSTSAPATQPDTVKQPPATNPATANAADSQPQPSTSSADITAGHRQRRPPPRSTTGTPAGSDASSGWAANPSLVPTSAIQSPTHTPMQAPALAKVPTHSPTPSSQSGEDSETQVGALRRSSSAGCAGLGSWTHSLTAFCPGTRMYPDDHPTGTLQTTGSHGTNAHLGGSGSRHKAPQQQQHSSEVIAILSGGALTGGQAELAAATAVTLTPESAPLDMSSFTVLSPFASCLQGREKKLKSEKNV